MLFHIILITLEESSTIPVLEMWAMGLRSKWHAQGQSEAVESGFEPRTPDPSRSQHCSQHSGKPIHVNVGL